jgi:2-dehydropantoate 2-reductase
MHRVRLSRQRLKEKNLLQFQRLLEELVIVLPDYLTQLATARAIVLEDIPFFPTKTLSELSVDVMVTQLRHIGDRWAPLMPHNKISALQDVERGKRLEVEETLGYAVRQSAALGIPTPTMDTCYKLIAGINHYLQ